MPSHPGGLPAGPGAGGGAEQPGGGGPPPGQPAGGGSGTPAGNQSPGGQQGGPSGGSVGQQNQGKAPKPGSGWSPCWCDWPGPARDWQLVDIIRDRFNYTLCKFRALWGPPRVVTKPCRCTPQPGRRQDAYTTECDWTRHPFAREAIVRRITQLLRQQVTSIARYGKQDDERCRACDCPQPRYRGENTVWRKVVRNKACHCIQVFGPSPGQIVKARCRKKRPPCKNPNCDCCCHNERPEVLEHIGYFPLRYGNGWRCTLSDPTQPGAKLLDCCKRPSSPGPGARTRGSAGPRADDKRGNCKGCTCPRNLPYRLSYDEKAKKCVCIPLCKGPFCNKVDANCAGQQQGRGGGQPAGGGTGTRPGTGTGTGTGGGQNNGGQNQGQTRGGQGRAAGDCSCYGRLWTPITVNGQCRCQCTICLNPVTRPCCGSSGTGRRYQRSSNRQSTGTRNRRGFNFSPLF